MILPAGKIFAAGSNMMKNHAIQYAIVFLHLHSKVNMTKTTNKSIADRMNEISDGDITVGTA
jgi:hypothetical protein